MRNSKWGMRDGFPAGARRQAFFRNAEVFLGPVTCQVKPTGTLAFPRGTPIILIRRDVLMDFHDIQATKACGSGLPGVPGDELWGTALLSRCDMQQIQSPAAGGGGSTGNHANRGEEYAPPIQVHPLESPLVEEIGLHFKTGIELNWSDLSSMEFGVKGVVKLQLNEKRIGNRESAGAQKLMDFCAQCFLDHQLQDKTGIKITRDHESLRRSLKIASTGVPGAKSGPHTRFQREARSDQSMDSVEGSPVGTGTLRDFRKDKKSQTSRRISSGAVSISLSRVAELTRVQ